MVKSFLYVFFSFFSHNEPEPGVFKSSYDHHLVMKYEHDLIRMKSSSSVKVDGRSIKCHCGRDPILTLIIYGHFDGFCIDHLPQIMFDTCCDEPMDQDELDRLIV